MQTVWKYPLDIASEQTVIMPDGSRILCAAMQGPTEGALGMATATKGKTKAELAAALSEMEKSRNKWWGHASQLEGWHASAKDARHWLQSHAGFGRRRSAIRYALARLDMGPELPCPCQKGAK